MAANLVSHWLSRRDDLPARGASDGSYNADVNAYILPPLIGLPYKDMRLNGEGARHKGNHSYYSLIVVHAVFMCLVFLLFVPFAIFMARFKAYKNPRRAIKLHIASNFFTLIFGTIGFICANVAVGKRRRYTNPHHVIGLTLYVSILLQAILGIIVHQRGKYEVTPHLPFRTMLHRWFGRAIWLLGLANIPLGLTLYGSPLALFILYALYMALLLMAYFTYEFYRNRHHSSGTVTTDDSEYGYGNEKHDREGHGFLGNLAKVGLGLFAFKKVSDMVRRRMDGDVAEIGRSSRHPHTRSDSLDDETHVSTHLSTDVGNRYGQQHHTADPTTPKKAAKVGLLVGLLAGRNKGRIIDDRKPMAAGRRPVSPSQQPIRRNLFGGILGKRKPPPMDDSLDDSPKKPRRGLLGFFKKDQSVPPPETDITTDYPDSDDSDDDSRYRSSDHDTHSTATTAAAAAGGAALGAAAMRHNNRHSRRTRPMSDTSYSYTDTDVDTQLSPTRVHSMAPGGLQPPPLAQNSRSGTSSNLTSSRGSSSHVNSDSHIPPPPPGGPPLMPIPLPPGSHHSLSSSNRYQGSPSRKPRPGVAAAGAGLAVPNEGHGYSDSESSIGASRRPGRSYRATEATNNIPPRSTVASDDGGTHAGYLSTDSQGQFRPHAALQVRIKKEDGGRTVTTIKRMPMRERTSVDGGSSVAPLTASAVGSTLASPTAPAPPSAIGQPLPSSVGGFSAAPASSVAPPAPLPGSRRGSASGAERESTHGGRLHIREEKRKSNAAEYPPGGSEHWQAVEEREAAEEDELKREREARRERRRRRKTGEGFDGSTIGSAVGSGVVGRPQFT